MKIKISTSFLFLFLLSGLLILFSFPVLGDNYKFETGIPGIVGPGQSLQALSLNDFIVKLIKILFPLAGILAFVMIVWAGFEYATSGGDTNKQKDAQDRIANAIIGLVLLFAFYLIIYTINPDILKTQNLTLAPITPPLSTPIQANMTKLNDLQIPLSYELLQGFAYADNNLGDLLRALFMNTYYTKNPDGIYEPRAIPIEWYVTEACITNTLPCQTTYTGHEAGSCHYSGTCVDIVLKNPTDDNKNEFIKIATKIGLNIYNEYTTACTTPGTTGFHFHVALECGGGSCWSCAK